MAAPAGRAVKSLRVLDGTGWRRGLGAAVADAGRVIPCGGGGILAGMARRRRQKGAAIEHLHRAAESHARIVSGDSHPSDPPAVPEADAEPTPHQRAAARQPRTQGGTFA